MEDLKEHLKSAHGVDAALLSGPRAYKNEVLIGLHNDIHDDE